MMHVFSVPAGWVKAEEELEEEEGGAHAEAFSVQRQQDDSKAPPRGGMDYSPPTASHSEPYHRDLEPPDRLSPAPHPRRAWRPYAQRAVNALPSPSLETLAPSTAALRENRSYIALAEDEAAVAPLPARFVRDAATAAHTCVGTTAAAAGGMAEGRRERRHAGRGGYAGGGTGDTDEQAEAPNGGMFNFSRARLRDASPFSRGSAGERRSSPARNFRDAPPPSEGTGEGRRGSPVSIRHTGEASRGRSQGDEGWKPPEGFGRGSALYMQQRHSGGNSGGSQRLSPRRGAAEGAGQARH